MSVAYRILSAVRNALAAVAMPGVPAVVVRKKPIARDEDFGDGQDALIVVALDKEEPDEEDSENEVILLYPVWVVLFLRGKLLYEAGIPVALDFRELTRLALHKPTLTGVSEVFDCDVDFDPCFDATAITHGYDVSALMFKYHSQEPRSA